MLNHTQHIELQRGRVRKAERWGPRTLDLDIMLFGDEVINTERLTVPHYDMKNRGFMLWPLFKKLPLSLSFRMVSACISTSPILVLQNLHTGKVSSPL